MNTREVETLSKLGLTKRQSEVYLALTQIGSASTKTIAKITKIDRAHTYRLIETLLELGLIKKYINTPTLFNAIPLQEGMELLLERKTKEFSEIKKKTKESIERIEEKEQNLIHTVNKNQFSIVKHNKTHIREFNNKLQEIKISFDGIIDYKTTQIADSDRNYFDSTMTLVTKGIKCRHIICFEKGKIHNNIIKQFKKMNESDNYDMRYLEKDPIISFAILDGQEVHIHTGSGFHWRDKPSFNSNNSVLVGIIKEHFDAIWDNASKIKTQ